MTGPPSDTARRYPPMEECRRCGQCRRWVAFADQSGWGSCDRPDSLKNQSIKTHFACEHFE